MKRNKIIILGNKIILIILLSACSINIFQPQEEITLTVQNTPLEFTEEDTITPTFSPMENPNESIETPASDEMRVSIDELPSGLFIASMSTVKEKIFIRNIEGQILSVLLNHSLFGVLNPSNTLLVYESSIFTSSATELFGFDIALFDLNSNTVIPIDMPGVEWGKGIPGDWSPDGEYIIISTLNNGIFQRLGVVNVTELLAHEINLWDGEAAYPDWSPDGENIAFSSRFFSEDYLTSSIYLLDSQCIKSAPYDCSEFITVLFSDDMVSYYNPSWSPDNRHLVFSCSNKEQGSTNLCIGDIGTGVVRNVPNTDVINDNPNWSPDGEWISSSSDGDIFVVRPDGSETKKIAEDEEFLFWILIP